MKNVTGLILAALLIFLLLSCKKESTTEPTSNQGSDLFTDIDTTLHIQTTQEGNLTIYKIDRYNTTVVKIPHISSYIYMTRPRMVAPYQSLKQIAIDSNYSLVVNASYFDAFFDDSATYSGLHFRHAGYLKIKDSVYENIKDDKQLSRFFAYNSKNNIVNYFGVNELDKTMDYDLVVQTGPQILWKNEVDTASINASINGNGPYMRTAFASVNGKEFYIIIALGKVGGYGFVYLADLGKMLRSSGIFKKELNVINFDGGLSTTLYVKNHPEFSWHSDDVLPILMCFK